MKKTVDEILSTRKTCLPSRPLYAIGRAGLYAVLKVLYRFKRVFHFDPKEMKGKQVVLISDHSSWTEFWFAVSGYRFVRFSCIVGYHQMFRKFLFWLMLMMGCIPKRHFEKDLRPVRQMMRVANHGGSLAFFPEGTFSFAGTAQPVNPGTVGLLKGLGLTVVLCKSYGAFCSRPSYKRHTVSRNYQEYHYEILFTPEELKEKTPEELSKKLTERFAYNDFAWNREYRFAYRDREPLIRDAELLLYRCPQCGAEYEMHTEGDAIVCARCGNRITMDEYYALHPATPDSVCPYTDIGEWFIDQRRYAREEVSDPAFSISYPCQMFSLHTDKTRLRPFYPCGEGTVTICRDELCYVGTRHGEAVELHFSLRDIPSFRCEFGKGNTFYYQNDFFILRPTDDPRKAIKYMLLAEEINSLINPTWYEARRVCFRYDEEKAMPSKR